MFSRGIKMELGLDKCAIINVVKGEVNNKDFETKIPILTDDDEYRYLGIAETSDILHNKMKEIEVKEFFKRVRAIGKAKLNAMNFTRAFNSFAVPVIRYGFGILSWTKTELQQLDRKTRKILTKAGYHHPKSNVHRLHAVREDGGRGIKSLLDTHEEECEKLATYLSLNVRKDPLTNLIKTMENERAPTKRVMRKRNNEDVKGNAKKHLNGMMKMAMHGQWRRQRDAVASIDVANSDNWMKYANLTPETESLLCAAQEQTLATNYIRNTIWNEGGSPLCRLCKSQPETVAHIVSGCKCLAGTKYTTRHDRVGTYVHWCLLKDIGIEVCNEWYKHVPEKFVEKNDITVMWDSAITTDKKVGANQPDVTVHNRKEKSATLIDFSVPNDHNIVAKTAEKLTKYRDLEVELKKCWNLKTVKTIPVIIGALGAVSTDHARYLNLISKNIDAKIVQKTALLGTANILRCVLGMTTEA